MRRLRVDVAVVGGGVAGLEAAVAARRRGAGNILVLERDQRLGGILHQCIHTGFGLQRYGVDLTGPEYIARVLEEFAGLGIAHRTDAAVLSLSADRRLRYVHPADGAVEVRAEAIILAMGCREKSRHMIGIPGDRPAGILTAGTAQRLLNIEGLIPGREVVIVGSGDIGLIMARRCCLAGMVVRAVVELRPFPGGLIRNVAQCLYDFDIPLLLQTQVTTIEGRQRVRAVVASKVDAGGHAVPGAELRIPCDTVLIAAGLMPENELSIQAGLQMSAISGGPEIDQNMEASIPGIFCAGDVAFVHNLVDQVSEDARTAGAQAAGRAARSGTPLGRYARVECGPGIAFVAPQRISLPEAWPVRLSFRAALAAEKATVRVVDETGAILSQRRFRLLRPSQIETIPVGSVTAASVRLLVS